jgi:putative flippase GtrA
MPLLLRRLLDWLQTHEGKKIFRYSMVSVVSTGCSFFVLLIVYGVLRVWTEVPSTVFANGVATVPSYWLNRSWAWGKSGRSHFMKEVVPFWTIAAAGIAFSMIGAALARNIGQTHHLNHVVQTALVLVANVLSFGIFWVLKLLLFNRLFKAPTLIEEIDEHIDVEEHLEGETAAGSTAVAANPADVEGRPQSAGV